MEIELILVRKSDFFVLSFFLFLFFFLLKCIFSNHLPMKGRVKNKFIEVISRKEEWY